MHIRAIVWTPTYVTAMLLQKHYTTNITFNIFVSLDSASFSLVVW